MKKISVFIGLFALMLAFGCNNSQTREELKEELKKELKEELEAEGAKNAAPFEETQFDESVVKDAELAHTGKIVFGKAWRDQNGKNLMIFCKKQTEDVSIPARSTYLHAYHYANANGEYKLVREVKDFYEDCDVVDHTDFQTDYITLSDIDNDDYAEITFTYRTGCNGDPTPVTQKLIMLEDGEKYAIRGTTLIDKKKFGFGEGTFGGETNVGGSFDSAPDGFLDFAKKIWEKAYVY